MSTIPPATIPSAPRSPWRYLGDCDVLHAAVVALFAIVASGGLVWLGYLLHVWRVAARSPVAPPRPMAVLVFGRRLHGDLPGPDYRQRLGRAFALARARLASSLLLLGGHGGGRLSEAAAGYAWLRQQGLPGELPVQLEQDSVDSLENLRHARALLPSDAAGLRPPVALLTSRYHLARCLSLARRLGFDGLPVAAEEALVLDRRYVGLLLVEATYLMWIDLGVRWARLIGHRRMAQRIS
ncbi:YdcF family protein [Frateuria sp. Soil773]|uniref:YdcF family protein n=1 Tax=Frateuria sp. Soil773 TaxID=1736407 RepID=UPI001F2B282F|nr:YdcF family protein [Frateuria sp. Soil773]